MRRAGSLFAIALAIALAAPGSVPAATFTPPRADGGLSFAAPAAPHDRDVVMPDDPAAKAIHAAFADRAHRRAQRGTSEAGTYYTSDGFPIRVRISAAYGNVPADQVQAYVDFVGSRAHGTELGRLSLLIATPQEIDGTFCAKGTLACYMPAGMVMVVPGERTPAGQAPVEYIVTHELGHHVANNRRNPPWSAWDWGPKRWASVRGVCEGVAAGRLHPGDQGEHYLQNPGENWAETFAVFHVRDARWSYDPFFAPDAATFTAVQDDVMTPWEGPATRRRTLRVDGRRRVHDVAVVTRLDGALSARVTPPAGVSVRVELRDGDGRRLASGRADGRGLRVDHTICGDEDVVLRVRRRAGQGRIRVAVTTPG